jgi:hypothetical protein
VARRQGGRYSYRPRQHNKSSWASSRDVE